GFVHRRSEAEDDIEFAVAVLDFVNLRGHEQPAVPYGAVACEFAAPPVHQSATQRACVTSQRQLINKRRQEALTNRLLAGAALVNGKPLVLCHVQKLLEEGSHLARCAGMNAQPLAVIESVPMLLSIAPGQHEDEEIRVGPV